MEAAVGHLVPPEKALVIEVGQGGESSAGEEIFFHIAYMPFDDPFFMGAVEVADRGVKEIVFGEVQKSGVELKGGTQAAADHAGQVIVSDLLGNPLQEMKGMEVAGEEVFQRWGGKELQVEEAAEGEDQEEAVDFVRGGPGRNRAGRGPVHLGFLRWESLDVEEGFGGGALVLDCTLF
jgi:hypothetical protein